MAIMKVSLADAHLNHIDGLQTTEKMRCSLADIFERHTLLNEPTERRRFYTATMSDTETVLTYTNRINHLAAKISAMGLVVDDLEMAMAELRGLPEKFYYLIRALDTL